MLEISTTLKDVKWTKKEPAELRLVQYLVGNAVSGLPEGYLALLLYNDSGEGPLSIEPGWFQLWSAEDVIVWNKSYEIDKYLPGFFGFGSNGGGELLAFDTKQGQPWKIVMIPFILMTANEAVIIAINFEEFIQTIGRE
jgi:hypothetical protein